MGWSRKEDPAARRASSGSRRHPLLSLAEEFPDRPLLIERARQRAALDPLADKDRYGPQSAQVSQFIASISLLGDEDQGRIADAIRQARVPRYIGGIQEIYALDTVANAVRRSRRRDAYRAAWLDAAATAAAVSHAGPHAFSWEYAGDIAEWASNVASALVVADLLEPGVLAPLLRIGGQADEPGPR